MIAQPGAHPQHGAGQERPEHCAGETDQHDVATAAIADVVTEESTERGAQHDGDDDPGSESLPLHGLILASPADASHLGCLPWARDP